MSNPSPSSTYAILREWLRNERRFGVDHVWGVGLSKLTSDKAAPERHAARSPSRADPPVAADPDRTATAPQAARGDSAGTLPAVKVQQSGGTQAIQESLRLIHVEVTACTKCALHAGRTQTVFGVGNPQPEIVFVGEGPGADEDRAGEPFVGKAGQLLTRMIQAMTLTRDEVYICNVVKCRPPANRTPTDDEMSACAPYLFRQLSLLCPRVIVALGRPAAQTLLCTQTPIGKLRGRFFEFPPPEYSSYGLAASKVMPTFHPAYLLRSPEEKSKVWDDLKQVMALLGIPIPRRD